jgi:hypothetical protein
VACTTLGELGKLEPAAAPSLLLAGWAVRELSGTNAAFVDTAIAAK